MLVLYGSETWSLTLREERRLRVYENRMLRRIFWPNRDKVTVERRKLHNEELNDINASPNILKNEMGGACSLYEREERCSRGFGGETLGKEIT